MSANDGQSQHGHAAGGAMPNNVPPSPSTPCSPAGQTAAVCTGAVRLVNSVAVCVRQLAVQIEGLERLISTANKNNVTDDAAIYQQHATMIRNAFDDFGTDVHAAIEMMRSVNAALSTGSSAQESKNG